MKLHSLDFLIVLVYWLAAVLIGVWGSRRGSTDLNFALLAVASAFLKFTRYDKLEKPKVPAGFDPVTGAVN